MEELQDLIEEANAPEVDITISVDYGTGTATPNGIVTHKVGKSFPIVFSEADNYQFRYWEILDKKTETILDNVIEIKDSEDPETRFTILENNPNILIHPYCIERPSVSIYSPQFSDTGVPRDTSIVITFNTNISEDNDFSKISITSDGESVKSCYKTPVVNENILTFAVDKNNLISISGETRKITVTLPEDFYYVENENKITLGEEFSWSFKVNNKTNIEEQITFSVPKEKGKITPEGIQNIKIGESIKIEFEPNDNYQASGWNIIDGDGNTVSESLLQISDKTLTSMTLTVAGPLNGVSITPQCYLLPAVISTSPKPDSNNVDCDSTITIKFNKPMKSSFFEDFSENSAISITNYGINVSNYYKPELSSDGMTLYIKPDLDTISNMFEGNTSANVVFTINKNACDNVTGDGYNLQSDYNLNLRLITNRETIKPEFMVFNIAKTREDAINGTNLFSDKDFNSFTSDDLHKNLTNSIWLYCKAKDSGGAVKCLKTTETVVQAIDGRADNTEYKTSKDGYGVFTDIGNNEYEALFEYKITAQDDGIINFSFTLCDYAGNLSDEKKAVYLSWDTHFTMECYELIGIPDVINSKAASPVNLPVGNIAKANLSLRLKDLIGNIHSSINNTYENDNIILEIYTGTSESDLKLLKTVNAITDSFSVSRDIRYDTMIRIAGTDECGNTAYKDWYIPKIIKPIILNYAKYGKQTYDSLNILIPRTSGIDGNYRNTGAAIALSKDGEQLKFETMGGSGDTSYAGKIGYLSFESRDTGNYKIYLLPVISISPNFAYNNKMEYIYGSIDLNNYVSVNWNKENKTMEFETSSQIVTKDNIPEFDINVSSLNSELKSYKYEVIKKGAYVQNSNIQFIYILKYQTSYDNKSYSDQTDYYYDSTFIFSQKASYVKDIEVIIAAIDNKGVYRAESDPKTVNNEDKLAPTFHDYCFDFSYGKRIYPDIKDEDGGSGLTETFNCYFVPTNMLSKNVPDVDSKKIKENYAPVTIKYSDKKKSKYYFYKGADNSENGLLDYEYYDIYYDGRVEQNYALYLELKDKAGNELFAPISNTCANGNLQKKSAEFECKIEGDEDYLEISYTKLITNSTWKPDISYFDGNEWIYIKSAVLTNKVPLKFTNITVPAQALDLHGKFLRINIVSTPTVSTYELAPQFSYTSYVYPDYYVGLKNNTKKIVCNIKNILEGLNGVTVLCDQPAIIHTMACSVSYEENLEMWETRGIEVDVKSNSSSFDYSIPVNEIPEGYYYTTIVHYADGYKLMTPVKQKTSK